MALLYVALPSFKESEGYDRADLDLTAQQVALIKAVAAVQPNTIVILNNGSPVAMSDWIDGAAAVLEAWMMGQAGGGAIADVLFGKVNPSGKLAETFPLKLADTPAYLNYPRRKRRGALWRRAVHRLSLLRCQRRAGAVPLWLRPELHHLRVQPSQGLGRRPSRMWTA